MTRNDQLNNTCINFSNEADATEIFKFYEDNGWVKDSDVRKIKDEVMIGVYKGELNYWWNNENAMTIIELPKSNPTQ